MTIGERIQEARKQAGMKQSELAEKLGIATITIGQYERDKRQPRIEQLQRIADALGIGVSYLLSGEATVSQTHLANGVHIYKDTFPFRVVEPFLDNPLSDSCDILYQDEYLIIAVEKGSTATQEDLEKILDAYAPFREQKSSEDAEFLASVKEGEFHTQMNTAFQELNFSGKREAAKRVKELTEIPRYRAETAPQSTLDSTEGTDTTPLPTTPETPPEGE